MAWPRDDAKLDRVRAAMEAQGMDAIVARALMTNPRMLLLDEPLEGLAPIIAQELVRIIRALRGAAGMAIVVVEQHARIALELTEHAVVLDRGRIVHHGASAALLGDPQTLHHLVIGDREPAGPSAAASEPRTPAQHKGRPT